MAGLGPDRPLGPAVDPLPPGLSPQRRAFEGRHVRLEPLAAARHAEELFASFAETDPDGQIWDYMGQGPWTDFDVFATWLEQCETSEDPLFFVIRPQTTGRAAGMATYLRTDVANGVTEIGNIWFSPGLQRTRAASEAIFLMMRHAFEDVGVRRLEWKCNALNETSRRAALRYGFVFEGVFRQHRIVKGRNRDTAWYAALDRDWPAIRKAFDQWFDAANFDADGRQKKALSELMAEARDSVED